MKILITGTNGFVGKELVYQLAKDKKNQISCLSRFYNKSFPQNIIQHIYSDFDKINDYSNFLKGCNIVIHLAAISNNLKNTKSNILKTYNINVNFTKNLFKNSILSGVNKFLFLSTIKVYGETTSLKNKLTENDQINPLNKYSQSKYFAEEEIVKSSENTNIDYLILRSPLIYGKNSSDNFGKLINILKFRVPLPLKGINSNRSVMHIDNLIDLIKLYIYQKKTFRISLNVCDDIDMNITDLIKQISKKNRKILFFYFPFKALFPLFKFLKLEKKIIKLISSQMVSNKKAKKILNWEPKKNIYEYIDTIFNKF